MPGPLPFHQQGPNGLGAVFVLYGPTFGRVVGKVLGMTLKKVGVFFRLFVALMECGVFVVFGEIGGGFRTPDYALSGLSHD